MKHFGVTLSIATFVLVVSVLLSIVFGPVKIPILDLFDTITAKSEKHTYQAVLFSVRLPRTAGAMIVGWSLALAGLCYQSLLKNPLASEYTLGVASGAAIGAVISVVLHATFPYSTALFAFLGSMLTMLILVILARSRFLMDSFSLVLAGVILSSFANAILSLLLSIVSPNQLHAFYFWFMGSFASVQWNSIAFVTPVVVLLSLLVWLLGWNMNAISIGEEHAQQIGISVARTKLVLYLSSSLLTALAVSIAGTIGFIGLVIPHLGRLIAGVDNRKLILLVPLLGGTFCVASDLLARIVLSPAEMPVGVITAFVGVPVFIFFLARRRS